MQFAVVLTFVATAMAAAVPQGLPAGKRQASTGPSVQTPAMTTADGTIVAFDSANVNLDSVNKGL